MTGGALIVCTIAAFLKTNFYDSNNAVHVFNLIRHIIQRQFQKQAQLKFHDRKYDNNLIQS